MALYFLMFINAFSTTSGTGLLLSRNCGDGSIAVENYYRDWSHGMRLKPLDCSTPHEPEIQLNQIPGCNSTCTSRDLPARSTDKTTTSPTFLSSSQASSLATSSIAVPSMRTMRSPGTMPCGVISTPASPALCAAELGVTRSTNTPLLPVSASRR